MPESAVRYDPALEQHLYRIVQQACENVLRHARAHCLTISGQLATAAIDLSVADDGLGFESRTALDLANLIGNKHFGLAGMYERAQLMQAELAIETVAGHGTQVNIRWTRPLGRPGP